MLYTSCPQETISAGVGEFFFYYGFLGSDGKGDWPAGGGIRDQSRSFLEAVKFARSEEAYWDRAFNKTVGDDKQDG